MLLDARHAAVVGKLVRFEHAEAAPRLVAHVIKEGFRFALFDAGLDHLIDHSDMVVACNTKVAFLALAMGRSVVTLADNPAAASGLTFYYRDFVDVNATLDAALAAGPRMDDQSGYESFLAWLDREYFYTFHRSGQRGTDALLERMLGESATSPRPAPAEGPTRPSRHRTSRRVFVDASRLMNPRLAHSGIARYGRETLRHLTRRGNAEIWAVVTKPGNTGWLETAETTETAALAETATGRRPGRSRWPSWRQYSCNS